MTSKELERLSDLLAQLSEDDSVTGSLRDSIGQIRSKIEDMLDTKMPYTLALALAGAAGIPPPRILASRVSTALVAQAVALVLTIAIPRARPAAVTSHDRPPIPEVPPRSLLGIGGETEAPTYAELYSGDWQHPTTASGHG